MDNTNERLGAEHLRLTHDGYFWEAFQTKRIAKAFLKKVLPWETLASLELDALSVERRHFSDELFKGMVADVIYRVPIRDTAGHVNFFVVIEHKSFQDFLTIFQLWGYVYQICRREFDAAKKRNKITPGYRLPPVIAIILHHGTSEFQGAPELSELFFPLTGIENHLPKLQAILVDLNAISDEDPLLDDPEVPELRVVMMVLKTIYRRDVALKIQDVLRELKPHSDDPSTRRLIRATWVYLANNAKHLKRNFDGLLDTFQEVVGETIMSTLVEMWMAEGEAKGKAEDVLRILVRQKGEVPDSLAERVREITDIGVLDRLFDLAFECESFDEFAGHLVDTQK